MIVIAYVDGACSGNPGPAGCGVVLIAKDIQGNILKRAEYSVPLGHTTNNVAEISAVQEALFKITKPCVLTVRTDSANVVGWFNGKFRKKSVTAQMVDVVQKYADEMGITLVVEKVAGHKGDTDNERADQLAREARDRSEPVLA